MSTLHKITERQDGIMLWAACSLYGLDESQSHAEYYNRQALKSLPNRLHIHEWSNEVTAACKHAFDPVSSGGAHYRQDIVQFKPGQLIGEEGPKSCHATRSCTVYIMPAVPKFGDCFSDTSVDGCRSIGGDIGCILQG